MSWRIDRQATQAAAELFEPYTPTVKRNGRQYMIAPSPYGQMELIPVGRGRYLVAAESPPSQAAPVDEALLAGDLVNHLRRNGLRAWRIVPGSGAPDVLRNLVQDESSESSGESGEAGADGACWSPYTQALTGRGELVGHQRVRVSEQLAATIAAQRPGGPLPNLVGPTGVGRRTAAAAAARMLTRSPVELPLQRLLTDRVFQTPIELFVETMLAAAANMADTQLLVVSEAEMIVPLPPPCRRQVLTELGRLPSVVLLSDFSHFRAEALPETAQLACPGLADTEEAWELLQLIYPKLKLAGAALAMICRAASRDGVGIIPARLLYLVRLGQSLLDPSGASTAGMLSPDEVTPAIHIAQCAWKPAAHGDRT